MKEENVKKPENKQQRMLLLPKEEVSEGMTAAVTAVVAVHLPETMATKETGTKKADSPKIKTEMQERADSPAETTAETPAAHPLSPKWARN